MQKIGDKALDFSLQDQDGNVHSLKDYLGKWVVLYFYPKDDTPGCTQEALSLKNLFDVLSEHDVIILGISTDSKESHALFKEKYDLPFSLLSDEDGEVCELYNALNAEGDHAHRISFLINADGTIAKIYNMVKPNHHAKEVLTDVTALQNL